MRVERDIQKETDRRLDGERDIKERNVTWRDTEEEKRRENHKDLTLLRAKECFL